jgi:hypothetical protein
MENPSPKRASTRILNAENNDKKMKHFYIENNFPLFMQNEDQIKRPLFNLNLSLNL